jgi:hypothetical protein
MNRAKYREIFDENLDNHPKHTAKTMQEWLERIC